MLAHVIDIFAHLYCITLPLHYIFFYVIIKIVLSWKKNKFFRSYRYPVVVIKISCSETGVQPCYNIKNK